MTDAIFVSRFYLHM